MSTEAGQSFIRLMPVILHALKRLGDEATADQILNELRQMAVSIDGDLLDDVDLWQLTHREAFSHLVHYGYLKKKAHGKWVLTSEGRKSKWPDWSYLSTSKDRAYSAQLRKNELPVHDSSETPSARLEEMTECMTQTSLPAVKEFYNPTLIALRNLNGSASNNQIYDEVMRLMELSVEQRALPHKTSISLATNRVQWALYHLKQAELLHSPSRAVYELTEKGKSTEVVDPAYVNNLSLAKLNQRRREKQVQSAKTLDSPFISISGGSSPDSTNRVKNADVRTTSQPSQPQSTTVILLEELIQSFSDWRVELLNVLRQLSQQSLEVFLRRVLDSEKSGAFEILSSQGGLVEGKRASGGIAPTTLWFHCYFGTRQIAVAELENLRRAVIMNRADRGLLITLGTVTGEAQRQAANSRAPVIDLMDGDTLVNQLKSLNIGITSEIVQVERITVDSDFFANI